MSLSGRSSSLSIITLTILAMTAFAANSVLCRLALGQQAIDAASFTLIRLLSGAVVLTLILALKNKSQLRQVKGRWVAAFMLFLYAITFSYSYISLTTGTGALILFGAVQISLIAITLMHGTRLHISEWLGVIIAFAGFSYLILPAVSTPSLTGFILMTVAGIAWALYTLLGRSSQTPLEDTCWNFIRTLPILFLLLIPLLQHTHVTLWGVVLAMLSGGIASGVGYAIWYQTLSGLTITQAAVVQLSVPIIAAVGGVIFMSEPITLRLLLSAGLVLGGILMVVLGRYASPTGT